MSQVRDHNLLIGAHISVAGGFYKAIERGVSIGCTALQIFTKSNRQWHANTIDASEVQLFKKAQKECAIPLIIVAHASYLINIGFPNTETTEKSIEALIIELQRCEVLSIPYLILHPGSHLNTNEEDCLNRIADNLSYVFSQAPGNTVILLETMAGQGSGTCRTFEHIARVIQNTKPQSRIGVCMDTCHVFVAGYDFTTAELYQKMRNDFDTIIGRKYLKAIHMNDSKKECGSHVDRHEDIGKGKIGLAAFSLFMNDETLAHVPKIVETPVKTTVSPLLDHKRNIDILKNLIN